MRRFTLIALVLSALVGMVGCPPGGSGTLRVFYDQNNATAGEVPVDGTLYQLGDVVTVLGNPGSLERDGYTFAGWNTQADAGGDLYLAGDTFTMGDADTTLYAEWVVSGPTSVTGVMLDESAVTVYIGVTTQLVATVSPVDAANTDVTWSSDNLSVATVSPTGVVTGESGGTANITVTTVDGGFTDTAVVTVNALSTGDLVISEIMNDTVAVDDTSGEWFEIYVNTSAPVNLQDLRVQDFIDSKNFTVSTDVIADPGDYVVFGVNDDPVTNGGVTVDYEYGGVFPLSNASDQIILTYDAVTVDGVAYDGTWPGGGGYSHSLGAAQLDDSSNNDPANWRQAVDDYGGNPGDYGTPGAANPSL